MLQSKCTKYFAVVVILAAVALAGLGTGIAGPPAPQPGSAPFAPLQPNLLGIQARNIVSTVKMGTTVRIRVEDPAQLRAKGLTGLNAGDEVEVTNLGKGKLHIVDPRSGEAVDYQH